MKLNAEFFNHLFILLSLMFGFTCFKVANCKPFVSEGDDFSTKKLLLGITRHLIVILGTAVVFAISSICGSELMLIQMGGTKVTLQAAIDITTLTILAVYGVKYVKNLAEYAGVTTSMPEVKELLPNTSEKVANLSEGEAQG